MKKTLPVLTILVAGAVLAGIVQAQSPLEGAWQVEEVTIAGGPAAGTNRNPQAGIFIFSGNRYSIVLVPGNEPRPLFTNQTTDLQRLAAYEQFIANSGTYEANGSMIRIRPQVAKNPAAMADEGFSAEYSVNGDLMTFVLSEAWVGQGVSMTYRLRRSVNRPLPPTFIVQ